MKMPKPKTTKSGFRTPFSSAVKPRPSSGRGSSRGGRGR